jgi:hypothetical protein
LSSPTKKSRISIIDSFPILLVLDPIWSVTHQSNIGAILGWICLKKRMTPVNASNEAVILFDLYSTGCSVVLEFMKR